jgi:hypothetical protein
VRSAQARHGVRGHCLTGRWRPAQSSSHGVSGVDAMLSCCAVQCPGAQSSLLFAPASKNQVAKLAFVN